MRELSPNLWEIEEGIYAERRGDEWFTSNEKNEILAGPFASPDAARADHEGGTVTAANVQTFEGLADIDDLMTLRQASLRLPVTYQALYAARRRGTLPEPRRVVESFATKTGQVELYSLAELAERYEGKTRSERIGEGARRGWAKLTPEQRRDRAAGKGKNR